MRYQLLVATLLLGPLAACADEPTTPADDGGAASSRSSPTTTEPSSEPSKSTPTQASDEGTHVIAADSDFGTILFDDTGQAMYIFDVETTPMPRCYDACAEAWPPVLTVGDPVADEQVKRSLLGSSQRKDGTSQVTYNGHPLYFYANEGKHEVKCHDVFLNGGNWYALQPNGQPAP